MNGVVREIRRKRKRKGLDMAGNKVVQPVAAYEDHVVEIRWTLKAGGYFYQRVTIPPKATREAIASGDKAIASETPGGPAD